MFPNHKTKVPAKLGTRDKRLDKYILDSADFAKPILIHLRKLIHTACPQIQETIKWRFPVFEYHGIVCHMASFKNHCSFGFWKAARMEDYDKEMSANRGKAMGHFGRITSLKDLPSDRTLLKYMKEACRLNVEGIKIVKVKSSITKKITIPIQLKKAFTKNKKAQTTFAQFSPSNKMDYVQWITEAKTDQTRNKRIETAVAWMAEGKIRNWKYVS